MLRLAPGATLGEVMNKSLGGASSTEVVVTGLEHKEAGDAWVHAGPGRPG